MDLGKGMGMGVFELLRIWWFVCNFWLGVVVGGRWWMVVVVVGGGSWWLVVGGFGK